MNDVDFTRYDAIDISTLPKNTCFHYTSVDNLGSIMSKGLVPAIGDNALGIEKSAKIFFTFGMTNSLILMESWLRWLMAKSLADMPGKRLDKPIYKVATSLIKIKIFQPLANLIVRLELSSPIIRHKEYKRLKKILDESVYFSLDLEYGSDYSLDDIDEVKSNKFDRHLLKLMYKVGNVEDNFMEYWNMHTFSGKSIEASKIHLLKVGESYKASDIIEYMRKNTEIKIKHDLPFLYGYFKWLKKLKEKDV